MRQFAAGQRHPHRLIHAVGIGLAGWASDRFRPGTVLLGGCAALDQKIIDLQMRGLESRSQAFKEGYRAGCASGYRVGGSFQYQMTKDVMRYDVDTEYQTGWDQAYADCRKIDINR